MGVVDSVDGLLLVYGPEADIAICVAFSIRSSGEGGLKTYPLSLPVTKYSSSIIATASILPSSYRSTPFLSFLVFRDSPPVPPPPRNTSCVSSTIFHSRAVRSRAPTVMQRSAFSAAIPTTSSWCPNSVSIYASSSKLHSFTVRSLEHEYSWFVPRLNTSPLMAARWCFITFNTFSVSASQITNRLSFPPVATNLPSCEAATQRISSIWP